MLANARKVSAFANKQALSAVLFVYRVMDGSQVPLIYVLSSTDFCLKKIEVLEST